MAEARPKQLIGVIEGLIAALGNKDKTAYGNLFSVDAVIRDPFGGSEFKGLAGVKQHFENIFKVWFYYDMRITSYYMGGDSRIALRWSVSATAINNRTIDFTGISIYGFDVDEKIVLVETYWNYKHILDQIKNNE